MRDEKLLHLSAKAARLAEKQARIRAALQSLKQRQKRLLLQQIKQDKRRWTRELTKEMAQFYPASVDQMVELLKEAVASGRLAIPEVSARVYDAEEAHADAGGDAGAEAAADAVSAPEAEAQAADPGAGKRSE